MLHVVGPAHAVLCWFWYPHFKKHPTTAGVKKEISLMPSCRGRELVDNVTWSSCNGKRAPVQRALCALLSSGPRILPLQRNSGGAQTGDSDLLSPCLSLEGCNGHKGKQRAQERSIETYWKSWVLGYFQGVSGYFQGVLPYVPSRHALWRLPSLAYVVSYLIRGQKHHEHRPNTKNDSHHLYLTNLLIVTDSQCQLVA